MKQTVAKLWAELSGKNPTKRLLLIQGLAITVGAFGVLGLSFGLISVALKILGVDTRTWSAIGNVLNLSVIRIVLGYSAAIVIHAIIQLHQKDR